MTEKTISGHVTANGTSFHFAEVKSSNQGGGPRSITISADGVANSAVTFAIDPNPHANPEYNKHQEKFYTTLAQHIVAGCKAKKKTPTFKEVKKGEQVPTIKGAAWTKMTKAAQEKAIKDYNTAGKQSEAAEIEKKFAADIIAYLKKYSGSCSFSSVSYSLKKKT